MGALQWTVTLGRFDIAVAVMTMSSFRAAPRQGHLDRVKRIVGYLVRMKNGFIRVRTEPPDYSEMPPVKHDWSHTVYGDVKEAIPKDLPKALGKPVVTTSYVDANLAPRLRHGQVSDGSDASTQQDARGMVCEETGHRGNRNLWIGIRGC